MRLVSYGDRGRERAGLLVGACIYDTAGIDASLPNTVRGLLQGAEMARLAAAAKAIETRRGAGAAEAIPAGGVRLGPPVPDASKVVCLGLNYADHGREQNKEPPRTPLLFAKAPSALCGPHDDIVLPPQDERVDCEAELAVVIGKTARKVGPEDAMDVVAGYMALNDVSARTIQRRDRQWFRGKSFDTFGPCGPALVTREEVPDPHTLAITSYINDLNLQKSNTSEMIFDIPHIVSYVSQAMTLLPGDVISTGTPSGVGVFRDPPIFLKPGDIVRVEIECIGTLKSKAVTA